jgi:hypothetical protein
MARIELEIYRYAHDLTARNQPLTVLKSLFSKGVRTPNWSFDTTLDRAKKDMHPNVPLLTDLIAVANDRADVEALAKYAEWHAA